MPISAVSGSCACAVFTIRRKASKMAPETAALRAAGSASAMLLPRLAKSVAGLGGLPRAGLAVLLGLLAAGAMPPFNLVPLLVPSFTGLVWVIDAAATRRRAFLDGWLWGMGFFVPCLYWICLSMAGDLAQFWWLIPFTVLGLPAVLSLYTGGATAATQSLRRPGVGRILVLAAAWALFEWLRGHVPFGGFPWVLIGYAWSADMPVLLDVLQVTAVLGIYGLSFLTVLVAASPARLGDPSMLGGTLWRRVGPVAVGVMLLAGCGVWGAVRLAPGADPVVPDVTLRLVQTDIPNLVTDNVPARLERLRTVLTQAATRGGDAVTAQIWPESSVDFLLNREPRIRDAVARMAPAEGFVLTGTVLANSDGPAVSDVWNSMAAIDPRGDTVARYDKAHLVPFGEYIPLHSFLEFIPLVAGRPGLSTGPGTMTMKLPHLPPVAPIICYEAIFPHAVVDEAHRPSWIVNVTNDAWFGWSTGPYQHFAIARVRAVEEGLPLVRAANGGISGVVDAHGRRVVTLPLGETGTLDVQLPSALPSQTIYGEIGDFALFLMIGLAISMGISPLGRF
jgi:apolipoprotein N-acyltransferase